MHALVTGTAGFIASHVAGLLLDRGRDGARHRRLHGLLPAAAQGGQPGDPDRARRFPLRRSGAREGRPRRPARWSDPHLPSGRAGRRPPELGPRLPALHGATTSRRPSGCWRRSSAGRSSASSTPRPRRCTATSRRFRCARTPRCSPVSPYGVTKLAGEQLAFLYYVNHGVQDRGAALLHGLRTAAATRHGLSPLPDRRPSRRPDHRLRRRRADARFHLRRRRGRGDAAGPAIQGVPGRVYNIGGGSRVSVNDVLSHRRAGRRTAARDRAAKPPQKGDMRDTYADTSLARADLGFAPTATLEDGPGRPSTPGSSRSSTHRRRRPEADDETRSLFSFRQAAPARRAARVRSLSRAALTLAACAIDARRQNKIPDGTAGARQVPVRAWHRGAHGEEWLTSREFFQTLIDTYPQSPHRADAKLGLADSYLGDGSLASQVLAINEYREFLSFFPTHPRADYAQYKLAMSHYTRWRRRGAIRPRPSRRSRSSRCSSSATRTAR